MGFQHTQYVKSLVCHTPVTPREAFSQTKSRAGVVSPHYNNLASLNCFCLFLHIFKTTYKSTVFEISEKRAMMYFICGAKTPHGSVNSVPKSFGPIFSRVSAPNPVLLGPIFCAFRSQIVTWSNFLTSCEPFSGLNLFLSANIAWPNLPSSNLKYAYFRLMEYVF